MNMPSSLPQSLTNPASGGLTQRFGNLARDAAPTLGAYLNIIRSRKWLVMGLTLLITALAALVVNLMTPIYRATATILIENNKSKIVSIEELYGVPAGSREFFQTQAEFMKSREVGMRVVNKMGLATHGMFDPRQSRPSAIRTWLMQFPVLADLVAPKAPTARTDEEAVEFVLARYKANLEIAPVRLSQLVELRFESPDPLLAAKIANETAEAYITADLDARFNMQ